MRWDRPGTIPTIEHDTPRTAVLEWLHEGQTRWRGSIASLENDRALRKMRRATWGELKETRWLIGTMIEHDLYHAGEINHIRALHHGNDE